jgi:hypothetical protein
MRDHIDVKPLYIATIQTNMPVRDVVQPITMYADGTGGSQIVYRTVVLSRTHVMVRTDLRDADSSGKINIVQLYCCTGINLVEDI